MKNIIILIVGLSLVADGIFGLTLEINTKFHYFGTGTVFGMGITLLAIFLFKRLRTKVQ